MFKKIREARLVERKDSNIQDALMKIEGVGDELLLDEDAMIRELIEEKIKEITDQGGVVRKVNDAEERKQKADELSAIMKNEINKKDGGQAN